MQGGRQIWGFRRETSNARPQPLSTLRRHQETWFFKLMAPRLITAAALGLALSACSDFRIEGRSREFSGVWLYEFEGSTFVDGATTVPTQRPPYKATDWLDHPAEQEIRVGEPADESLNCYPVQPFLVTFIGYRTRYLFGSGHLGLWRSEITVQKPISIESLGPAFCYTS